MLKYFVPKIWATIPLVGGTVESHNNPKLTPKIIEFNIEGGEKMKTQRRGQDAHRQDHHFGGRGLRLDRKCEGEDPGQGGHSTRPAAPDLRRKTAGGRPYSCRL